MGSTTASGLDPLDAHLLSLRRLGLELSASLGGLRSGLSAAAAASASPQASASSGAERWPALLRQYAMVSSQLQAFCAEAIAANVGRELASSFVFLPLVDSLDPQVQLRVKPEPLVDEDEARRSTLARESSDLSGIGIVELEMRINSFNQACVDVFAELQSIAAEQTLTSTVRAGSSTLPASAKAESIKSMLAVYFKGNM